MQRIFLPLPTAARDPDLFLTLGAWLSGALKKESNIEITDEQATTLITQGSVWAGNHRIKDPAQVLSSIRTEKPGRAPSRPDGDTPEEKRYGPWLQIFYPEYPIVEYTLDPAHVKYEDDDLLIVWKEPFLNSCQSVFSDLNCLTWGVQKYLDSRARGGFHPYTLNTINRLDYATRGLVFFAKHKVAEQALHRMFMDRHMHKRYLVVTPLFDLPIAAPRFGLKIRDVLEWKGKQQESVTLIRLAGRSAEKFFWIALPQTGRTHQIRKHFQRYLVPIVGDPVYGEGLYQKTDELLLACIGYRFRHPINGKRMRVDFVPQDMIQDCDQSLKLAQAIGG